MRKDAKVRLGMSEDATVQVGMGMTMEALVWQRLLDTSWIQYLSDSIK